MHMKMFFEVFDLVMLPLWLRSWFVLLFTCLRIVIYHPIVYVMVVSLPWITLCFCLCCYVVFYDIESALLAFVVGMHFSHNIITSI